MKNKKAENIKPKRIFKWRKDGECASPKIVHLNKCSRCGRLVKVGNCPSVVIAKTTKRGYVPFDNMLFCTKCAKEFEIFMHQSIPRWTPRKDTSNEL